MADQVKLRLSIAAIKRVDPYVKDIDDKSSHVAVYTFNSEEESWEKPDADVSFFIYSRNAEPYRSVFIDNKFDNRSLVEPITAQTELKIEPPYLFFRNELSRGRCFFFRNNPECNRIGTLIQRIIRKSDKTSNYGVAQHSQEMNKNGDIFSILSKAQEEFNNSTACIPARIDRIGPEIFSDRHRTSPDMPSQSVMNFFAAAKPKMSKEIPFFQKLSSKPMHVNQIEKQQLKPHENKSAPQSLINITKNVVSTGDERLGSTFKRIHPPLELSSSFVDTTTLPISIRPTTSSIRLESSEDVKFKPKPVQRLLKKKESANSRSSRLMSPIMFSVTKHSTDESERESTIPEASSMNAHQLETNQQVLSEQPDTPEPLTQGQLLQAMSYLIRNDSNFVKKLHEAYLNYFTETLSL